MSIKLIAILLVIALLWWIYDFCGGDLTCRPMDYVIRSPLRWIFSAEEFLDRGTHATLSRHSYAGLAHPPDIALRLPSRTLFTYTHPLTAFTRSG
jgi:hypothetical protein